METIILTKKEYTKNPNTKTTYLLESEETKEITMQEHHNITSIETQKYFRRFGGSESANYNYTSQGYKVVKLTSTSPNKETKIIRTFKFD
jgi:hypothetical protein